jgi:hypothetical protein
VAAGALATQFRNEHDGASTGDTGVAAGGAPEVAEAAGGTPAPAKQARGGRVGMLARMHEAAHVAVRAGRRRADDARPAPAFGRGEPLLLFLGQLLIGLPRAFARLRGQFLRALIVLARDASARASCAPIRPFAPAAVSALRCQLRET